MNQEFVKHALNNGKDGQEWLNKIPEIVREYEKKWSITIYDPFNLSYNYVAPAERSDGTKVVLKIGFPKDPEFQTEIDALEIFNGEQAVRLFEKDRERAVILIEQVMPGESLSSLEDDDKATRILASVMKKLWKPLPVDNKFITISEWSRELKTYMQKYNADNGPLPWNLIEKANDFFKELIATQQPPVLTHGDLHHDNVLSSDRAGWLVIDPKGIAAEPAFETAAMIRNPYEKMYNNPNSVNILQRRIVILSEELEINPKRIWKWCFAQSVLSAVWNDAGIKGSEHAVAISMALEKVNI